MIDFNLDNSSQPESIAAPQQGNSFMKNLLDFLKSPGGSSIIGAGLGGLANVGQARALERTQDQNNQMSMQQALLGDMFKRDSQLEGASPVGWAQNYEQQTLMKNLALQKLMQGGGGLTPTNADVAAKLKGLSTPVNYQIPDEWKNVNPFGVDQTMQSLAQRQGTLDVLSQGRGPALNFGAMGYDPTKAAALDQQGSDFRKFSSQQNPMMEAMRMSPGVMQAGQQGGQSPQRGYVPAQNGRGGMVPQGQPGMGSQLGSNLMNKGADMGMNYLTNSLMKNAGGAAPGGAMSLLGMGGGMATGLATMGIGAAIPAGMALYKHLKQGAYTNDDRDAFKSQYGDPQGHGLQNTVDSYNGPDREGLMNAYQQFLTAGKRNGLGNSMTSLQSILGGGGMNGGFVNRPMQNPYNMS